MNKMALGAVLVTMLCACGGGGGSDYDYLYEAPTGGASSSLMGRWGGSVQGYDTRWVFEADEVTLANKCGGTIVGVTVAARVSDTTIQILESDQDGGESCFVRSSVGTFNVCSSDEFTPKENCFVHAGTSLTLYSTPVDSIALTKLQD